MDDLIHWHKTKKRPTVPSNPSMTELMSKWHSTVVEQGEIIDVGQKLVDKDCGGVAVAGCRKERSDKIHSDDLPALEEAARVLRVAPVSLCSGQYTNRRRLS